MAAAAAPGSVLNVNIGILGHVDAGKTALVRALSTSLSTAALDKHPQSKARGITLDLGFSAFFVDMPERLRDGAGADFERLQFTLVDCPGHASLLRTVLGGSSIVDVFVLVLDVTEGVQPQTAECLVLAEILSDRIVVVLNKCDKLPEASRAASVAKMRRRLAKTFAATRFGADAPVVCTSAAPAADGAQPDVSELTALLRETVEVPARTRAGEPFLFAVDHCFAVRGQGTVLTGTVLRGTVRTGAEVEVVGVGTRPVKSMQRFRQPVAEASQGDRLGLCVKDVDPKTLERGLACAPGSVPLIEAAVASVTKIRFHAAACRSKGVFHVSIGHATVMATAHFFGGGGGGGGGSDGFDFGREYAYLDDLEEKSECEQRYAVLVFDRPVRAPLGSVLIGSRLDTEIHKNSCRLAFHGRMLDTVEWSDPAQRARLRAYRVKERVGRVQRVVDEREVIGKDMFSKATDMTPFLGMRVTLEANGREGVIEGSFGASGKYKVAFRDGMDLAGLVASGHAKEASAEAEEAGAEEEGAEGDKKKKKRKKKKNGGGVTLQSRLVLRFKKFVFDPDRKRMVQ